MENSMPKRDFSFSLLFPRVSSTEFASFPSFCSLHELNEAVGLEPTERTLRTPPCSGQAERDNSRCLAPKRARTATPSGKDAQVFEKTTPPEPIDVPVTKVR